MPENLSAKPSAIATQKLIAGLSVVLFLGKLWAWYLTNSVTILTDALESTVNVLAGFIGLYAVLLAARPRDTNHPYGHGKVEFISAAIEGSLIIAASLLIIYQGAFRLIHPPAEIPALDGGILLIAITGVINFLMGRYALHVGRQRHSAAVNAAGRHLVTDAYSTAAIIAGLLLLRFTGWLWLDAVVALLFSVFIFYAGYKVLRHSLSGIMDEADISLLQEVIQVLNRHRRNEWIDLHNLRVIRYGEVLHVDAHMTLPYYLQVRDADREIHLLEALIRDHFGGSVELFVHVDGCVPYQCKLCNMPDCPVRQHPFEKQLTWTIENVMRNSKHGKDSPNPPADKA
ncbi:MAG: cation transporter [Bacteroidetes bacterium]|nr:cation transporter [Bacteroidota bacterium]